MDDSDALKLYSIESSREDLKWLVTLFASVNVLIIIIAVLLNLVALVILVKQRSLHNPSNAVLASMCIADLVSTLLVQTVYEFMLECLLNDSPGCINNTIVKIFHVTFTACKGPTSFITAMVSVDRYMAICFPFKYLGYVTITRNVAIVASFSAVWTVYSLCLILLLPLKVFYISIVIILFFSITAMNISYMQILIIVHKQRVRVQAVGEIGGTVSSPQEREKSKSFVIIFELMIFNLFNLPILIFAIQYLVNGFENSYKNPFVLINVGFTLSNMLCLLNPIVYCFRSSEIRKAAKKMLPQKIPVLEGRKFKVAPAQT